MGVKRPGGKSGVIQEEISQQPLHHLQAAKIVQAAEDQDEEDQEDKNHQLIGPVENCTTSNRYGLGCKHGNREKDTHNIIG